jgi:hypothetical protein
VAISFVKFQNTVRITISGSSDTGSIEVLDPPLAGRLFAESHMPKVGDSIIFDAPPTPDLYVTSIRVQGRDLPKTTTVPPVQGAPVTYVFGVANGPSSWTVSAVGQDDSVTIVRGET